LRASGLTGPRATAPDEVVRRHGAMQAQEYPLAKWAIGQRADGLVDEDVDRALTEGSIVRTHVLRPTWHFVPREDLRWILALTGPRVRRGIDRRYRDLELDGRTLARCESAIAKALTGGNHLTRAEVGAVLDGARIDRSGQRLPFILTHFELEAMICSGGLSGKQHTYALVDERVPRGRRFDRDRALVELTRRYLKGHGPATVQDFRWWSSLTIADIRAALDALGSEVQREDVEGMTFWSLTATEEGAIPRGGVQLLHLYDELAVGYTQSRYLGDPRAERARAEWEGRNYPTGAMLHDGLIAGVWRRTLKRDSVVVEAFLYDNPTGRATRALAATADELARFVGRNADLRTTVV
jgi:hypothetical protein